MTRGPTLTLDAWAGSSCRFSAVGSAVSGDKTPEPTNHGSASVQQPKAPAMGACSHAPLSSQRVSGDLQRCILGDRSVCSDVGAVIHAAICHRVHEDGSAGTGSAGTVAQKEFHCVWAACKFRELQACVACPIFNIVALQAIRATGAWLYVAIWILLTASRQLKSLANVPALVAWMITT